jgi:hypothetical protein
MWRNLSQLSELSHPAIFALMASRGVSFTRERVAVENQIVTHFLLPSHFLFFLRKAVRLCFSSLSLSHLKLLSS